MLARAFSFWMWRLTLAGCVLFLLSAEYSVVSRAGPGTLVIWPWLHLSIIYCYAPRLWSQICVTSRSCWFPDLISLSWCAGTRFLGIEGWLNTYEMVTAHFVNPNLSGVVAKCWFLGLVEWERDACVQSLSQPWDRCLTNINGCHAAWGGACLFPVCGWFEWSSSGVVGFYDHEPSWCCSHWLCSCVRLRSVDCWPNPCKWWNTWPLDDNRNIVGLWL